MELKLFPGKDREAGNARDRSSGATSKSGLGQGPALSPLLPHLPSGAMNRQPVRKKER